MSNRYDTNFEYLEQYHQNGGTYILPVEIVNDLTGQIEDLINDLKEANDSIIWWSNRYNAMHKNYLNHKDNCESAAEDILKELNFAHHISYGAALAIRQKILNYEEINYKEVYNECNGRHKEDR